MIDYNKIGLKIGLEIHQQLDTSTKLFCNCSTKLGEEVHYEIKRKLRPTKSELGEFDPASIMEYKRNRDYIYQIVDSSTCLVELDEEPPHPINLEAVELGITISLLLNCKVCDEIHVMRKEVIDGSNTTGFQRTAVIGLGGYIYDGNEKIGIETVTLEEDSARKIEEKGKTVIYRLDRLSIPLIEISTSSNIRSPEQAKRVAYKIGTILRSIKKVKRGLGTIRQDINISISEGAKVEIKGVQELGMIPKVIELEIQRQLNLIELRNILLSKNIPKPVLDYIDVTTYLKNTQSNIVKKHIEANDKVFLLKLRGWKDLLKYEIQPNRRFATELADYVKAWTNLEGIIHSDELPAYGITKEEKLLLYKVSQLDENKDAYILVMGDELSCLEALNKIVERIEYAYIGVPEETRNFQLDGTTKYARPRPGAARMYPETDIPPLIIEDELLEKIKNNLPVVIEDRINNLQKNYNISNQQAQELVDYQVDDLFEEIVSTIKVKPSVVATVLTQTTKYLKRSGIPIENIKENMFKEIFKALEEGKIVKETIEEILTYLSKHPNSTVNDAIKELNIRIYTKEEIEKFIKEIINERYQELKSNKENAFNILLKISMSKLRGRADANIVSDVIKELIKSI